MTQQKSQPLHWRRVVRRWLAAVVEYRQRSGFDFELPQSIASQRFPPVTLLPSQASQFT